MSCPQILRKFLGLKASWSTCVNDVLSNKQNYSGRNVTQYLKPSARASNLKSCLFRSYGMNTIFAQCWKCGAKVQRTLTFCPTCNSLQKPDANRNLFEVIGISQNFHIEPSELAQKFRTLQNMLHPDRFSNKDEEERNISEQYSALINKAYQTLQHPLTRGLYMLKLGGRTIEEGDVQTNPEFLMEIMKINEQLAEANEAEDVTTLDEANKMTMNNLIKILEEAFNRGDMKAAEETLVRMKYYESLNLKLREVKSKMGIVRE